jgi:hypothetical protein
MSGSVHMNASQYMGDRLRMSNGARAASMAREVSPWHRGACAGVARDIARMDLRQGTHRPLVREPAWGHRVSSPGYKGSPLIEDERCESGIRNIDRAPGVMPRLRVGPGGALTRYPNLDTLGPA